jgi:tetratricopeptide (TPR) repeat protein
MSRVQRSLFLVLNCLLLRTGCAPRDDLPASRMASRGADTPGRDGPDSGALQPAQQPCLGQGQGVYWALGNAEATRALEQAERSHGFIRSGRYAEAVRATARAMAGDAPGGAEGTGAPPQSCAPGSCLYNWHLMAFAASMAGQREVALQAARQVTQTVDSEVARRQPWLESVTPVLLYTMVTFGDWDDILAEPPPPPDLRFTSGMAYYARGMAFAALHRWAEAGAALDSVRAAEGQLSRGDSRVAVQIAGWALSGEIKLRDGRPRAAVEALRQAVALEDGLAPAEPPIWYYPARHSLGKALLAAGLPREAEAVYRTDLTRFPENGWALFGLMQSLEQQGRMREREAVARRFQAAWKEADVRLVGSRF